MHGSSFEQTAKPAFTPLEFSLCWEVPSRLSEPLGCWCEHIPFGFALVEMLRPRCVVELGVHTGDSYLAFCQAVKTLGLEARCYGVDHWKGDQHAGYYGPEVFDQLFAHHAPRYGSFSQLVRATFDEAVQCFSDGQIDLLHIDGCHTYESNTTRF